MPGGVLNEREVALLNRRWLEIAAASASRYREVVDLHDARKVGLDGIPVKEPHAGTVQFSCPTAAHRAR